MDRMLFRPPFVITVQSKTIFFMFNETNKTDKMSQMF